MMDTGFLIQYMETFYGYGTYQGRFWFVGIEEAGAKSVQDNIDRITTWERNGKQELKDLADYHHELGLLSPYLGENPKIQRTWGRIVRMLLAATSHDKDTIPGGITPEAVRAYQRDLSGTADGDTCLIELLPLSAKSTGGWMWGDNPPLPYLRKRKVYQDHIIPRRAEHIAKRIREHKPAAVVFYGFTSPYKRW
jgi:hypothetical protein